MDGRLLLILCLGLLQVVNSKVLESNITNNVIVSRHLQSKFNKVTHCFASVYHRINQCIELLQKIPNFSKEKSVNDSSQTVLAMYSQDYVAKVASPALCYYQINHRAKGILSVTQEQYNTAYSRTAYPEYISRCTFTWYSLYYVKVDISKMKRYINGNTTCTTDLIDILTCPDDESLVDVFLEYHICVWYIRYESSTDIGFDFETQTMHRAKFKQYNFKKPLNNGCRFEENKQTLVCKFKDADSCDENHISITDILAMPNHMTCGVKCIDTLIGNLAMRRDLCIAKYVVDGSSVTVENARDSFSIQGHFYREFPELFVLERSVPNRCLALKKNHIYCQFNVNCYQGRSEFDLPTIIATKQNSMCDQQCINTVIEFQAKKLFICILLFDFSLDKTALALKSFANGDDFVTIPQLLSLNKCMLRPNSASDLFCRIAVPTNGCDANFNLQTITLADVVATPANDLCDQECIDRLIEAHAKNFQICILKFKLDESTSSVTFNGSATGDDYRQIQKLSILADCMLHSDNTTIFCRPVYSADCTKSFRNGENFFDSLGFGEETTSKMMHSVLKSNICLWRLSYELDENKEIHFDDYGNRLTEYQYRKKIDDCIFDNITQTVTCKIADKPCEANSIQEFKLTSVDNSGTDAAELINMTEKLVRARNRMGPCIVNIKEKDCKIKGINFYNYIPFFSLKVFCSNVTKENSMDCWASGEQIRNEQILEAVTSFDADSYGCKWDDSSKENFKRLFEEKLHPIPNKESIIAQNIHHIVLQWENLEVCNVKKVDIELSNGCISNTNGIFCVVPQKGECNPNYFAYGKGLDSVMLLPRMSTCSKKSLRHSFEEMWFHDDMSEVNPHWIMATTEIPTTTDRYAFINSVDSSKSKYAPVNVEFFDPPTKEEISKRRKANEKLAEEKQKLKAAMSLSSRSVLVSLLFFFY